MIAPASWIGFGLAALLVAWCSSALLGGAAWLVRRRSASVGPAVERVVAASVVVGGPATGLLVLLVLVGHSFAAIAPDGGDHCAVHEHHPHLCLVHGASWADQPWAVVASAMFGAYLAVRLLQRTVAFATAHRATRRLARVAHAGRAALLIAPADSAFCFVSGLRRPRIFVSSSAWQALDEDERHGMLAHEQAHIAQHDVLWRAWLGTLSLVGAPWVASRMFGWWGRATERLCDARAAEQAGAESVALALVKMTRLGANRGAHAGLAFGARADVVARVEALLGGKPTGARATRGLVLTAASLFVSAAVAVVALADPLHHALETILGAL